MSGLLAGGSGAGGRVAIYHSTNPRIPPYRGSYDIHGGPVSVKAEAGASGTVYVKHVDTGHSTLRVDNRGQHPKVYSFL